MRERADPAHAGVLAGRLVGALTAAVAVGATLLPGVRRPIVATAAPALAVPGVESGLPVAVVSWGTVALAAITRYVTGYVVGSLVGVVFDWLDRPPLPVLVAVVFAVGVADGALAAFGTRTPVVGAAYLVAWLCYVPAFVYLFDDDGDAHATPRRLGDS